MVQGNRPRQPCRPTKGRVDLCVSRHDLDKSTRREKCNPSRFLDGFLYQGCQKWKYTHIQGKKRLKWEEVFELLC